jgi:hypothetical protein
VILSYEELKKDEKQKKLGMLVLWLHYGRATISLRYLLKKDSFIDVFGTYIAFLGVKNCCF